MNDFEFTGPTEINDNTVLVTSAKAIEDFENSVLMSTIRKYNGRKIDTSSVFVNDNATDEVISLELIDALAVGINSSRAKVMKANNIILKYLHANALFGRYLEILRANIPSKFSIDYGELEQDESRRDMLADVRFLIDSFNHDVGIEGIIQDTIIGTIREGNYSLYCRMVSGNSATIDHYPLDICYPSGYKTRGNDVLEFDISALRTRLWKPYKRTRKGKKIYYENIKKEVNANYPAEIYTAFASNETCCRLANKYSAFLKINDMDRVYGVSTLFKALKPLIVLDNLMVADVSDSKARSKKIVYQRMSEEFIKNNKKGIVEQQHAHMEAAQALQSSSCLYTSIPGVVELSYVTPKSTETDYKEIHEIYTQDLLRALGLPFLDSGSTTSVAKTNVSLLLRLIDSISVDLSRAIEHFYEALLEDNGYPRDLCPKFKIAAAEENELSIRRDLADFMFNTLGCSYETAYGMLDVDVKSEVARREYEKSESYDEKFKPHQTAYTYSPKSDTDAGRPTDTNSDNPDRQDYDRNRYQTEGHDA